MPGNADIQLRPLDALGVGGKKYGEGDVLLPYLSANGSTYEHSNAAITLPMLTSFFTMDMGVEFTSNVSLPRLASVGQFGMVGEATLPMLTFAGSMTFPVIWSAAFSLPALTGAGAGVAGAQMAGAALLPQLTMEMRVGGRGAALLPRLVTAGAVTTVGQGSGAAVLPLLATTGTISVFSFGGAGAAILPALIAGPYGSAHITLPMLQGLGAQFFAGVPELAGDFEGWLLNVRNGGLTRITNFPFTQFATVGNKTYAIGPNGLYLLGGEEDNGEPIKWQFETGLDDLGKPGTKHIPYLYLDGIIDGVIQIVLIDDRNREFGYQYNTKQRGAVHLPHRRKLGNGIRTRSMAFRISSDTGAYIELDSLEPQISVTQRSI